MASSGGQFPSVKYPKGIKVSDEELEKANITRSDFHGEWSYTIGPTKRKSAGEKIPMLHELIMDAYWGVPDHPIQSNAANDSGVNAPS